MFDIRYKNLRIIPSRSAGSELLRYGFMIEDCREILQKGYSPRKRKKDTVEKWMDFGNKTYNVVAVKSFNYFYSEDIYLLIHFGEFTKKKLKVGK